MKSGIDEKVRGREKAQSRKNIHGPKHRRPEPREHFRPPEFMEHFRGHFRGWGQYTITMWIVGLILLLAAALKTHFAWANPDGQLFPDLLIVEMEWILGMWLISGYRQLISHWCAILVFTAFCVFNVVALVQQVDSCGCLGAVEIPPAVMLVIDLAIVAMLVNALRLERPDASGGANRFQVIIGIIALTGGLGIAGILQASQPATLGVDGVITGDVKPVLLEPQTWPGSQFPLHPHLQDAQELKRGRWRAVLYHHDCGACLTRIEQLANETPQERGDYGNLALIELPPFGHLKNRPERAKSFRIDQTRNWLIATPTVVWLNYGQVDKVQIQSGDVLEKPQAATVPVTPAPEAITPVIEHDFGYVEPGETYPATIELPNPLNKEVKVTKVHVECECTALVAEPEMIGADGRAIQINFAPPDLTTRYAKSIVFHTDDPAMPKVTAVFRASINLPLVVSPAELNLGTVSPGEKLEKAIEITNHGSSSVKVLYATSDQEGTYGIPPKEALASKSKAQMQVHVTAPDAPGEYSFQLQIRTTSPIMKTLTVPVRLLVAGE